MTSFLVTYLFYNEEGIPIQTSLPVLAKDESDARNTMKLLAASKFYQFKEMDNETLRGCIAIIGIIVVIAIAAFFVSIFIYLLWPVVIPAVFPKLVAEGYIVGKLSPALSLGVAVLCTSLFKGASYKK